MMVKFGDGNKIVKVPFLKRKRQKISDQHIIDLYNLGKKLEKHYYFPQDVEWAIEGKNVYLVQTRPITTTESKKGEVSLDQIAMLEDRIRIFEGKRQVYGTQFDWDENNQMSPSPIENLETVDIRREMMGLPPLFKMIEKQRELVKKSNEKPPKDKLERRKSFEAWLIKVGWRKI
jgi:hypothetical protein